MTPLHISSQGKPDAVAIVLRDITDLKRAEQDMQKRVITDNLTGVANRGCFDEELNKELSRAVRYSRAFSIILCDMDNFKEINDTWGHAAGDWALKEIAKLLRERTRVSDVVARYGGDEFAVILIQM